MKELSIEEKAKRYDEAIEIARQIHDADRVSGIELTTCEEIFPSLKESEDEEIKKWIRKELESKYVVDNIVNNVMADKALAWLEKQGEQESVVVVIPKFRVGDVIRHKGSTAEYTIESISGECYHGKGWGLHIGCEEDYELVEHKPAENSAKVSESSTEEKNMGEYKKGFECGKQRVLKYPEDFGLCKKPTDKVEPKFEIGDLITNGILVGKIDEIHKHGYHAYFGDHYADVPDVENWHKWTIQDAKDGDVLADDYGIYIFEKFDECDKNCFVCIGAYQYSQKVYECEHMLCSTDVHPATKEQRDTLMKAMADAGYTFDFEKKELKKIEQKKTPIEGEFPYDNPSDTLEGEIENVWGKLSSGDRFSATKEFFRVVITHFVNYIKEQDDRELVEQKYVWSEEDEKKRNLLIAILNVNHPNGCFKVNPIYTTDMEAMSKDELVSWLKSLGPQKQWKPNDKLIRVIEAIINNRLFQRRHLDSLYQDLKKLKE